MRTALGALAGLLLVGLSPESAAAAATRYVLHTAAYEVEDACSGGVVVLNGDFVITQSTKHTADGGTDVRSAIVSTNLQGVDQNGLAYRALDVELSFVHDVPTQVTTSFTDAHTTLLLPRGKASKMLLVTVFKQTVTPDGTTSVTLDNSYTRCLGARKTVR